MLTYQEGAIALDNVIERSMLHLAHRLTHKAINAGATKQAHLLLQVRANPITMLCSALTGLTVIAMAAMFVTRSVRRSESASPVRALVDPSHPAGLPCVLSAMCPFRCAAVFPLFNAAVKLWVLACWWRSCSPTCST